MFLFIITFDNFTWYKFVDREKTLHIHIQSIPTSVHLGNSNEHVQHNC